jgi:hypothetical protein
MFFSEEKNQKTFALAPAYRSRPWPVRWGLRQQIKVFWFFSSEKNMLPYVLVFANLLFGPTPRNKAGLCRENEFA